MLGFHNPDYQSWHQLYCSQSKMAVPWSMQRLYSWEQFVAKGYTQRDLVMVIKHIHKRIRQNRRYPESLAFRNMVGNLDRFAEDLSEARAENRAWVDPNKAKVLRATGRPERTLPVAKPAQVVVQKLVADLRKAVETA